MKESKRPVWILLVILGLPCLGLLVFGGAYALRKFDYGPASRELDEAVAAYRAAGMPWEAGEVHPRPPKPEENAADGLRAAMATFDDKRLQRERKEMEAALDSRDLVKAGSLLSPHRQALALATKAVEKPRLDFGRDWDYGARLDFSEVGPLRNLIRALALRAELLAASGKDSEAMQDLQTASRLAERIGQESGLIQLLTGIAGERIVSDAALRCATHMQARPGSLERLAKSLGDAREWDLEFALRAEAYLGISTIRNLRYHGRLIKKDEEGPAPEPMDEKQLVRTGVPEGKMQRAYMARMLQYWTAAKSEMDKHPDDRIEKVKALDTLTREWDERRGLSYLMNAILVPVFSQTGISITRAQAERIATRELLTALIQQGRTGKYPTSVDSMDPFAPSSRLKVKSISGGLVIYSVGPDGVDNGGINQSELRTEDRSTGYDVSVKFPPRPR